MTSLKSLNAISRSLPNLPKDSKNNLKMKLTSHMLKRSSMKSSSYAVLMNLKQESFWT
jgi:hypothetical protein